MSVVSVLSSAKLVFIINRWIIAGEVKLYAVQINTKYQIPNIKYTTPKEQTYHSKYQIHFPKYQNRPTKIQHQCIQNTKFSHLKPILGCEIHLRDGVLAKLHNRQRSFYWRTRTNVRIGEWNVLSADKTPPSNCENMNKEQMVEDKVRCLHFIKYKYWMYRRYFEITLERR